MFSAIWSLVDSLFSYLGAISESMASSVDSYMFCVIVSVTLIAVLRSVNKRLKIVEMIDRGELSLAGFFLIFFSILLTALAPFQIVIWPFLFCVAGATAAGYYGVRGIFYMAEALTDRVVRGSRSKDLRSLARAWLKPVVVWAYDGATSPVVSSPMAEIRSGANGSGHDSDHHADIQQ